MADLTRDDITKLAALARLDLSEAEQAEFAGELNAILQYVQQLQQVEVDGLKPTQQVTGLTNVMRDDVVVDYGYAPRDLLKNAPVVEADQLRVKRMIG